MGKNTSKGPIGFPISPNEVANLIVFSEGVPSFNDDRRQPVNRARAHSVYKHLIEDSTERRERIPKNHPGAPRLQGETTAFRDFTEMCQAGAAVLNSAWGRFAIRTALTMGAGTRAVFEVAMVEMMVRVGKPGNVALEPMKLTRMILEAPPPYYEPALKIQSFFPIRDYRHGQASCEFIGKGGKSGTLILSLPDER